MKAARLAVASLLFASGAALALPEYTIIAVTPPGVMGTANGVNGDGTVVGCMIPAGTNAFHAFTWKDGSLGDLGPGCATAINAKGLVGGHDNAGNLVLWSSGAMTPLGIAGDITAINDNGVVVGRYHASDGRDRAFMYAGGQLTTLPDDGASSASAAGINSSNQVIYTYGGTGRIYKDGAVTTIPGIAGASFSLANGINEQGVVVGGSSDHGPAPYVYANGVTQRLPNGPGFSYAVALNNVGQVIGSGEGIFGYLIDADTSYHSLSTLASNSAGWGHLEGEQVNDRGWIVGSGVGPTANPQAYLLRPVSATSAGAQPEPPAMPVRRSDFNGDGRGDLFWKSGAGAYGIWLMNGARYTSASGIPSPAAGAAVVLRADFDGDGKTDLLWKDASNTYYVSLVNGFSLATTKVLDGGSGWIAVGSGDFDGDGRADLLWWHASQGYGVWLMSGAAIKQSGFISYPPTATTPAAIGDFDGSGTDDILWRGDDGHFELYTMAGLAATAAGPVRAAGTGFNVVALGDFNGDRKADIVWGHPDGRQSLWLMNGAATINSAALVDAGTGWRVAYAVDLDGDGASDLIWAHTDGSVGGWLMNGTAMRDYRAFLGAGSGWSLAGTGDFDGNGRTDLVWRYTDGSYGVWMMDGLTATSYAMVLTGGTGWETAK